MKVKELFAGQITVASTNGALARDYFGHLRVDSLGLDSLLGSPSIVTGNFSCAYNNLTSLKHGPTEVRGHYDCSNNPLLTSLVGAAPNITGDFDCVSNNISTLEGAPAHIGGYLNLAYCKLSSLKGIHKQIKYIGGDANFGGNQIDSHILGLLKIGGLKSVRFTNFDLHDILNKHLEGDRDIFACQEELIEAGYPEYAQL